MLKMKIKIGIDEVKTVLASHLHREYGVSIDVESIEFYEDSYGDALESGVDFIEAELVKEEG